MVAPQGKRKLEQFLSVLMDEQGGAGLSPRMVLLVADARAQWAELDRRIAAFDAEFVRWVKENEEARRLTTIPGIGAIVASALVAAVGRAESFDRGRDLAAWLGLVPRQFTTGGKPKLLGISKRGNKYLRKQLIHGARAALPYVAERDTPLGRWAKGLMRRTHRNVAVVAFANKLARIAWAVLRRGKPFAARGYAGGGVEFGRSELESAGRCKRGLREGDDEMASHGEALVNLGVRAGIPVGFRDPRSAVWPEPTRHEPARLRARSTSYVERPAVQGASQSISPVRTVRSYVRP